MVLFVKILVTCKELQSMCEIQFSQGKFNLSNIQEIIRKAPYHYICFCSICFGWQKL